MTFTDEELTATINGLWVLIAGVLCFLLQAGFGLLEAGSVRAKNAKNIMIKNLLDAAVAALAYWAVGFAFAYGEGGNPFIGLSFFFLKGTNDYIMWFFQFVFAGTTATIVSGAVAERCRFMAYIIYSFALTGFIYPVVAHWVWNADGFLYGKVYDFAGGGAVHGVGGAAAMAGAYFLGPRIGRFVKNEETGKVEPVEIPGHNLVLAALGGFILWFGFFPFNCASGANIVGFQAVIDTGRVAVVTTLAGATGAFTLLFYGRVCLKTWDMMLALNGLLAGMVATCSGVNAYEPPIALVVGASGSMVYYAQNWLFENVLHIDDPLGASALHMGAGFWGLLLVGFLGSPDYLGDDRDLIGIFYGGNGKQLGYNLYGMVVYFSWAFGTCAILFWTLNYFGRFRVSEEVELMGMDIHHHGGHAYRLGSMVTSQLQQYTTEQLKADSAVEVEKLVIEKEEDSSPKKDEVDVEVDMEVEKSEELVEAQDGGMRRRKRRLSSLPSGAV